MKSITRIAIISFFISVISTPGISQEIYPGITVKAGAENKNWKSDVKQIIHEEGEVIYTFSQKKNSYKYFLEKFSLQSELITSQEYSKVKINNLEAIVFNFLVIQDKLFAFYITDDRKLNIRTLYAIEIDKTTLTTKGEYIKIAENTYKDRNALGSYTIFATKAKDRIYVFKNTYLDGKDKIHLELIALDASIKERWRFQNDLPYIARKFAIEEVLIDDNDNFIFTGVEYVKERAEKKLKADYIYHMFIITNQGKDIKDYVLESKGKFITHAKPAVSPKGDIICGVLLAPDKKLSVNGAAIFKVGLDPVNISQSFSIDLDIPSLEKSNPKEFKSSFKRFDEFIIRDITFLDNGSYSFITEQYHEEMASGAEGFGGGFTGAGGGGVGIWSSYNYYGFVPLYVSENNDFGIAPYTYVKKFHKDNMLINISADGKLNWNQMMYKSQVGAGYETIFYSTINFSIGNDTYLLFNENSKNLEPDADDIKYFSSLNSVPAIVRFDAQGTKEVKAARENDHVSMNLGISCWTQQRKKFIVFSTYDLKMGLSIIEFK